MIKPLQYRGEHGLDREEPERRCWGPREKGRVGMRWAEMKLLGWGSGRVDIQASLTSSPHGVATGETHMAQITPMKTSLLRLVFARSVSSFCNEQ